jgi:phage protein D
MFTSSKPRHGTYFEANFPTMPTLERKPLSAALIQSQGSHDVLKMTFKQTGPQWFNNIPTGLPMQFTWVQQGVTTTWVGYVSYVSKVVTSLKEKTMEVSCIGSSFPLKERATRVFLDTTIVEAAAAIAQEFGLEFVGDPHPRRFPQLTIAGHSYWAWLQEQAHRIGYVAYVDGVTLYFRSIDNTIFQNSTSIPVLSIEDQSSLDGQQFYDRTMEYFKVFMGDYIEGGASIRTEASVGGVDPFTGDIYTASASPKDSVTSLRASVNDVLFSEYRADQVVSTDAEATGMATGAVQAGRLNLPAKVRCLGDYRMTPYSTVQVLGTGSVTDGYWVVKDVVHSFDKYGKYTAEMTILTDGVGDSEVGGFRYPDKLNQDVVNIPEVLSNNGAIKSAKAAQPAGLRVLSQAASYKDLGFKKSPDRWKATR